MALVSVLSFAHQLVKAHVRPGDTVVDATAGNGVDTLFLAELTGKKGTVYGFDIQEQALKQTAARLLPKKDSIARVHLLQRSHADMLNCIPPAEHGRIAAVMFNLGYLPHADETVITRPESTIPALAAAVTLLKKGGIITVVLYPGHPGGREECEAVYRWAEQLDEQNCHVLCYRFINRKNTPPFLLAIAKK
jgi:predicted methyltransferase